MFDLLIQNGTVIDGSGEAGYLADVAVENGKIVAIGHNLGQAKQVLDATNLVVTPGFIDSHSHADSAIIPYPQQIEKVEQGITTSIGGQCGASPYPVADDDGIKKMSDFFARAVEIPQGANIAAFAGHKAIRKAVMGMATREPTEEELETMKELLRDAMDAGAMGVSFGLIYTPSCYATLEELIALAKVAAEKGGMVSAHIRSESDRLEEAVEEFIAVVKACGARGVLSHHKACGFKNHGKVKRTLKMLERANAEGFDIYCDVYPYTAARTTLSASFIPKEYVNSHLPEYLKDPALRAMFREKGVARYGEDLSWVMLNVCNYDPAYSGKTIDEVAKLHGKDHWETMFDILEVHPGCCACFFSQNEEDMKTVMSWERAMICTDSSVAGKSAFYHPRLRGSFPRALGKYVRGHKVVSLPEMIRKMTSLPAFVYDLENKGYVRVGYDADLCVFDPEKIIDKATYIDPSQRAEGLNWVVVGGAIAAENAVSTGSCKGKVLLRKA